VDLAHAKRSGLIEVVGRHGTWPKTTREEEGVRVGTELNRVQLQQINVIKTIGWNTITLYYYRPPWHHGSTRRTGMSVHHSFN